MHHNKEAINANNKRAYCKSGLKDEYHFVQTIAPIIGEDIRINPEKENNPLAIDCHWHDQFGACFTADIKTEKTPYFTAQHYHSVDPQFAVTFGLKDMYNYSYWHTADYIIFHVKWETLHYTWRNQLISVKPLHGVWYAPMTQLRALATPSRFHVHLDRLKTQQRDTEIKEIKQLANRIITGDVNNLTIYDCIHASDNNDKGNFVYDVREFSLLWHNPVSPSLDTSMSKQLPS